MSRELDLILRQAETVTRQIERAVTGLTEEQADYRFAEGLMSIRETLLHLVDNYIALREELHGRTHEFGTWRPSAPGMAALVREWLAERERALAEVAERHRDTDLDEPMQVSFACWSGWKVLSEWIVLHDSYHLGQICALRLAQDPDWYMYSVYDPDVKPE